MLHPHRSVVRLALLFMTGCPVIMLCVTSCFCVTQTLEKPECDRDEWCKEQGAPSVLSKIITTGFRAIHLIYFFTAGADEVKCWQIRKGTKAPQVNTAGTESAGSTCHGSTGLTRVNWWILLLLVAVSCIMCQV